MGLPIILLTKDLKQRKGLWGTDNSQASETPNAGFDLNGDETIQSLEKVLDKKNVRILIVIDNIYMKISLYQASSKGLSY